MAEALGSQEEPTPKTSWWAIGGIVLVALLARLLFGMSSPAHSNPSTPPPQIRMRLTEGRLSGQDPYAPYPTIPSREEVRELRRQESPKSTHDRVIDRLLNNNLDGAIAEQEKALQETPSDGLLLSDLSALYIERASRQDRPGEYAKALELAEHALTLKPDYSEALFNRALALEHLFFYSKAADAWEQASFLASPWSQEALRHSVSLKAIEYRFIKHQLSYSYGIIAQWGERPPSLIEKNPQLEREIFESLVLPEWAKAVEKGQTDEASSRLKQARHIAQRGGNRIFLDVVGEMEAVAAEPPTQRQKAPLAQALHRAELAWKAENSNLPAVALREFATAEHDLRSIGSSASLIVSLDLSSCQLRQDETGAAREGLEQLGRDPRIEDYPSLAAWRQLFLGDLARRDEDLNRALEAFTHALDLFREQGEISNMARSESKIASTLDLLGRTAEGWQHRYRALAWARGLPYDRGPTSYDRELMNQFPAPLRTRGFPYARYLKSYQRQTIGIGFDIFDEAAKASLLQRFPQAALNFQGRAVNLARYLEEPETTALALLTRARIEAALGKPSEAKRDFLGALNLRPTGKTWASRVLAARIDTARSEIADAESRAAAIASESFVPDHLDQQADFELRREDTAAGERSLERALDELEQRREKVTRGDKVSFFDQAKPLYERLVALEVHSAQPEKALNVLERFRARALLDEMGKAGTIATPLAGESRLRRIPERTDVVVYAIVDGRLVTLLVQRSGVWMSPGQPEWRIVSSWIQRLREHDAESDRKATLEWLYGTLVAPWQTRIGPQDRIVFVPTDLLFAVPFPALLDHGSGRFLVEDHAMGVSPSVSEFAAALERDRRLSARPPSSVLLVGNPDTRTGGLPSLPGSEHEIQALGRLYRDLDVQVLKGADATPERVTASLSGADIVHLAVHGINDSEDPMRSHLFLSPSAGRSGELTARDLLHLRLDHTRLVVLASCGSYSGPLSGSEGSLSLGYFFLSAGAPAVVASLWLVNDSSTARLSIRFHQELRRGADPLIALQTAQRAEIEASRDSGNWTWASFQVFGGVEERRP